MPDLFGDAKDAHDAVVEAYRAEFSRAEETWRAIETKAQGTVAVAGIFAGFALNFAKDLPTSATAPARWLTVSAVSVLALSIGCAAGSLMVRSLDDPPSGGFHEELRDALWDQPSYARWEYVAPLRRNVILAWQQANASRGTANARKARLVRVSQGFLLSAIVVAAVLAVYVTFVPQKAPAVPPSNGPVRYEVH